MRNTAIRGSLIMSAVIIMVGIVDCKAPEPTAKTFPGDEVNAINITTGGNDVILRSTEDSAIKVSVAGYKGDLSRLEGDTLTIDIPMPKAGINLKASEPLYVDIPKSGCQTISVTTEVGAVTIDNVETANLSVKTQYGDITTTGLQGNVHATTDMGGIHTDLPSPEISTDPKGSGSQLDGVVGDAAKVDHDITLYTSIGDITLK